MTLACAIEVPEGPPRGEWRDASRGRDLLVDGRVVARVRPMPGGGWYWFGLGRNSSAGKGARAIGSIELACAQVTARACEQIAGLVLEPTPGRSTRAPAEVVLDRALPGLGGLDLHTRVNLFCRLHLLVRLPEGITDEDVDAVRRVLTVFHDTGTWPEELGES